MIIASKQSQVSEIKKYIEENSDKYEKLYVFGVCTKAEATSEDYLDLAVKTIDDDLADDDEALLDLFTAISHITEGKFNIFMLNGLNAIDIPYEHEGELIYEKTGK